MKFIAQLFPLLFAVLFYSCNTTEPGVKGLVTIEPGDVSCIESWLIIETSDVSLPTELKLYRDNIPVQTKQITENKTVLYDTLLTPNRTYKYKAKLAGLASEEISVTTLDTTSHEFIWETFTFGEHSSSVLNDVAIIDENNIWAVGAIYLKDSLGQTDPHAYNAVHWNGEKWEIKRIKYYGNCSAVEFPPLKAIWAFTENNIVVTNGGSIGWFDSNNLELDCQINSLLTGAINSIWGSNSNNLFIAGNNGNIAHYDGINWKKIESGTTNNITEIHGIYNDGDSYNKYCAADNVLLKIDGNNRLSSINAEADMFILSVWGVSNRLIYTAGNGVVLCKNYKWEKENNSNLHSIYRIQGQDHNDIAALSSTKAIFHFNGYSWKSMQTEVNNIFLNLRIKDNSIAAVGWQNDKAAIMLLKR